MFHVEQRVCMRILCLILTIAVLFGCNKPNPNPELADPIYSDLQNRAQDSQKELDSEKKKLDGFKKELDAVKPQTGEIKYAQKRYFESEAKVQRLEQEVKYYELKAQSRKRFAKQEYMKAFIAGKTWPVPDEAEAYKVHRELSSIPTSWDSRKRVKSYEETAGNASKGAAHGGEHGGGGEKKPEASSGGH